METLNLFQKVNEYLRNEVTIEELEDWLTPRLGSYIAMLPSDEKDLAGTVELGMAEMSAGQLTEDQFCDLLRDFMNRDIMYIGQPEPQANRTSTCAIVFVEGSYDQVLMGLEAGQTGSEQELPADIALQTVS